MSSSENSHSSSKGRSGNSRSSDSRGRNGNES